MAGINAITFGAYGSVLRLLPDQDNISSITLAGASAGLIQVTGERELRSQGGEEERMMRGLTDTEPRLYLDSGVVFTNSGQACGSLDLVQFKIQVERGRKMFSIF